jgi:hypothetical protein
MLEGLAGKEGLLDRLWHTNCFTQALQALRVERCQAMSPEEKSRLALALANCQLQVLPLFPAISSSSSLDKHRTLRETLRTEEKGRTGAAAALCVADAGPAAAQLLAEHAPS